jgi:putative methionine-R-sulfoxide reductase with GAF domain
MSAEDYLLVSGIDPIQFTDAFHVQLTQFAEEIELHLHHAQPVLQWQYVVPELGEGGACSLFGQLAAEPYDLAKSLGGKTALNETLLRQVTGLVEFYRQHSASDWFGVYQKRVTGQGESILVKLAYYGAASRPEFPLTPAFAAISNNSTVGLSGQGRIINQVSAYRSAGGEYYTCDPNVNAEACLPVLDQHGKVLGIVDSETFIEHTFVGKELALLVAVVRRLSIIL